MQTKQTFATISSLLCLLLTLATGACNDDSDKNVYISNSPRAYAYHLNPDCKALKRTTYTINTTTKAEAQRMGRHPCKVCSKQQQKRTKKANKERKHPNECLSNP